MKTNSGMIYTVSFTDKKEQDKKDYCMDVYAVNEDHARAIFMAREPDTTITEISEYGECISQHYGETKYDIDDIPEIALAKKVMFAILHEMSEDKEVVETYAQDVLDMAYNMTKHALHKIIEESHATNKK